MTVRATLFASIRAYLGVTGEEPARRAVVQRLNSDPSAHGPRRQHVLLVG